MVKILATTARPDKEREREKERKREKEEEVEAEEKEVLTKNAYKNLFWYKQEF